MNKLEELSMPERVKKFLETIDKVGDAVIADDLELLKELAKH